MQAPPESDGGYTPPEVDDEEVVQRSPARGELELPETPPPTAPSEFDIVTGANPAVCTGRRKAAAAIGGGGALAAVLVVVLIMASGSGDTSADTAGAALLVSGAPFQTQRQRHQHTGKADEPHLEKTIDTASFAASTEELPVRHYVCMYECGADEPKDWDPALVHTVGGCQTTPCSAFGVDFCGIWGGQRSESFALDHTSREVCERYVEHMTPVPMQQR